MKDYNDYIKFGEEKIIVLVKIHKYQVNEFRKCLPFYVKELPGFIKSRKEDWFYFIIRIDNNNSIKRVGWGLKIYGEYESIKSPFNEKIYTKLYTIDSDETLEYFLSIIEHCKDIIINPKYKKINDLILQSEDI